MHTPTNNELRQIAREFAVADTRLSIMPYGKGLINDTYLITLSDKTSQLILQRINTAVFPQPEKLQANIQTLTEFINNNGAAEKRLQIPMLKKTRNGRNVYRDSNNDYWRAMQFIADTHSIESIASLAQAQQVGFALGHFHFLLRNMRADSMYDTLPGFHITPQYLKHYQQVTAALKQLPHSPEDNYCRQVISRHRELAGLLEQAKHNGQLKTRIIHGDPKINNFLFHNDSGKAVSLIDLDTVKPGLLHYDIGDCLRSCCQSRSDPVNFDLEICCTVLEYYFKQTRSLLNSQDYQMLLSAIKLLPYELGLRFYTDYLQGNRYFKVKSPDQNLQQAVRQFQLLQSIITQQPSLQKILGKQT